MKKRTDFTEYCAPKKASGQLRTESEHSNGAMEEECQRFERQALTSSAWLPDMVQEVKVAVPEM